MAETAQTSADREAARRRPLDQYVINRARVPGGVVFFSVERSAAGSKPSHLLINRAEIAGQGATLEEARRHVPAGFKRMDRRKDDPIDLVEVWV